MDGFDQVTVDGKTAVVVGGTSGIGEAIALGFAESGADVVATSRTPERIAATAEKLRKRGAATIEETCDVTDRESIASLCARAKAELGNVDVLVNSAGTAARTEFLALPEAEWDRVLDVQLTGVFRTCQVFAREMNLGSIVNISSMSADLARSRLLPYCVAKAGINSFTRCLAKELAPDCRVNAIAPGFVITPLTEEEYGSGTDLRSRIDERTPLERVAERDEIIGAAVYLASDAASFTTGEILRVDGGFTDSAL